jgi:hypothetical protein
MSILGVSSREAAAAYWRREQRPFARASRMLRGVTLGPGLKWVGAGLAAAVAVGVFTAIVLALGSRDGDPARSTPATQAPSALTPGASPTAAATSVSTPDPASGVIGQIGGEPVYELVPAAARELPAGSVLYTAINCAVCNGGPLYRLLQDESGRWVREQLLPDAIPGIEGGYPVGSIVSDGTGRFAVLWCLVENDRGCGKTHDGTADTRMRAVVRSDDGGVTWARVGTVAAGSSVVGFEGPEVVVLSPGEGGATSYHLLPSGSPLDGSGLIAHGTGVALPGSVLRPRQDDPSNRISNDESSVFSYSRSGSGKGELLAFPGGHLALSVPIGPNVVAGTSFGRSEKIVINTTPPREPGAFPRTAVLVDLAARTVSPIAGLSGDDPNDIFQPNWFLTGPLLRVTAAGDCLNVREEPSLAAAAVRCFADGVLLAETGERASAGGLEWAKVEGPAAVTGWAALEFVRPVGPR